MRIASLLFGLSMLGAGSAAAQSMNITKPKAAAQKAVAATNEHTKAMTTLPADTPPDTARRDSVSGRVTQAAAGSAAVEPSPEAAPLDRETFRYERAGRRDPFVSLMTTGELRPLITDLRLTSIAYDARGTSVAILRDLGTKEQYRVRVGESLGRMRVARIAPRSITFTIEEFGFSRQETLSLNDPNKEISQ